MVLALVCSGLLSLGPSDVAPDGDRGAKPPPESSDQASLVPWFIPRSASLGIFINWPMVSPHFRLTWEGALLSQPHNDLVWLFTVGSGAGLEPPRPMTTHYQHVALAGFGYRSDWPWVHWGFHVVGGVLWYRAGYLPGSFYQFESRVLGFVEGRLQLGIRITPHFRLAAYFGYASPLAFFPQFPGNTYAGGVDTGLVFDWR